MNKTVFFCKFFYQKTLFTMFLLVNFSCASKFRMGQYNSRTNSDRIIFRSDSTFEYNASLGWHKLNSNGNWRFIGNSKIILNSSYGDSLFINVSERRLQLNKGVYAVKLITSLDMDTSMNKTIKYKIIINDSIEINRRNDIYYFNCNYVNNIRVVAKASDTDMNIFFSNPIINSYNYRINSRASNYFIIDLPIDLKRFYYKVFKNDTIIVKNSFLYDVKEKNSFYYFNNSK